MNPAIHPGVTQYRSGDRSGLRSLAANAKAIKPKVPPTGDLEGSSFDGGITFRGWALLRFYRSAAVTVTVTDNGTVIYRGGTSVLRRDINARHDPRSGRTHGFDFSVPWPGGQHEYCVRARSSVDPSATARLGCVTWHG